jgi:diguanylate cyclase (GGDEF)-like protein
MSADAVGLEQPHLAMVTGPVTQRRGPLRGAVAGAVLAGLALHALNALTGFGGRHGAGLAWVIERPLQCLLVLVPGAACLWRARRGDAEALGWALLGAGIVSWGLGLVVFDFWIVDLGDPPYPSLADGLWLAFYPLVFAGLVLLRTAGARRPGVAVWLDGLTAALAVAALMVSFVYRDIVATTGAPVAAVATNLAYPAGDLLLLALVAGACVIDGRRLTRRGAVMAGGLALMVAADAIWTWQVADGGYVHGRILDTCWPAALAAMAAVAWMAPDAPAPPRRDARGTLLTSGASYAVAIAVIAGTQAVRETPLGLALAVATLLAVAVRIRLAFAELRDGSAALLLAHADELTGLGNRRALMRDLRGVAAEAAGGRRWLLLLFDLDRFKAYNDAFGHPAGDALLARLGMRLGRTMSAPARAYRLGGDEFCVLAPADEADVEALAEQARMALTERGEGFHVSASFGLVVLPDETVSYARALHLADERMYLGKHRSRPLASQETRDLLLRILDEQQPDLHDHSDGVGALAVEVARRLGMRGERLDEVRHAADLHDIGKVAIPTAILRKPGPLNDAEWELMRTHTLIGERILAAVPRLAGVGRIVRSTHERWDGGGYPDGLAAERIPLAARIVAACDAWEAMTEDRVYRRGMPPSRARAELRRASGTQFDPQVVEVLLDVLAGQRPDVRPRRAC